MPRMRHGMLTAVPDPVGAAATRPLKNEVYWLVRSMISVIHG